ncbi:type II toxin-antitoxin system VapB family antitoxin [Starkeya koreensis]|uniref:Type II toxin-antitoxin system VapB family antitoxin n=1 Tax=Ancylobacter koreensis TaxID=266121 RepID=A0ABT0DNF3_9HYPH|nr:type II toxin-antitoxin system VapB family antitoxin [Ancylobacter koreensis]MCK0208795.1 type II toxin-antitoxin system VapB family antitoxin [Ancylobacter koreensis]
MGLNIKNEATHAMIRELAARTGESQTAAVTEAVKEKLERLKANPRAGLAKRLMAIVDDTAPRFRAPWDTMDHADLLYDEDGLPK